jgi:glycosyltransferase involved in cell wall biosynthesis
MYEPQPVYLIFPTNAIGGAEKRMLELWVEFKKIGRSNYYCLMHDDLLVAIENNSLLGRAINPFSRDILTYSFPISQATISFQRQLRAHILKHIPGNAVLHFVLLYPAFAGSLKGYDTVFSLTESSLRNVNWKGKLLYWLSAIRSKKVDVLDPGVFQKMQNRLFWRKKTIYGTPGSFVDTTLFVPAAQKKDQVVFLGRFFFLKQIKKLVLMWPEVMKLVKDQGIASANIELLLLGYGQEEDAIRAILKEESYQRIAIKIEMTHQPEIYLAHSKLIFSLQLNNNYPSKSLLEALSAGNIPVVTDVGDTRKIADPSFSYYVPENFLAQDIANAIVAIWRLDTATLKIKQELARTHVKMNFSVQASVNYYQDLYDKN